MNISMSSQSPAVSGSTRLQVQMVSGLFGAVFLLVGILGFVPGITANLGSTSFAGHHTDAALLGLFQVTVLHNIVHLLFGIVGMLDCVRVDWRRTFSSSAASSTRCCGSTEW